MKEIKTNNFLIIFFIKINCFRCLFICLFFFLTLVLFAIIINIVKLNNTGCWFVCNIYLFSIKAFSVT